MKQIINFPGWAKHKGRWVDDSTWYCTPQKVLIEVTLALSMFKSSIWTFNYTWYCFCVCYKKVQRNRIPVHVNHDVRSTCHSNRLSPKIVKMFLIIVGRGDWSWSRQAWKIRKKRPWMLSSEVAHCEQFVFVFLIVLDLNKNNAIFLLS